MLSWLAAGQRTPGTPSKHRSVDPPSMSATSCASVSFIPDWDDTASSSLRQQSPREGQLRQEHEQPSARAREERLQQELQGERARVQGLERELAGLTQAHLLLQRQGNAGAQGSAQQLSRQQVQQVRLEMAAQYGRERAELVVQQQQAIAELAQLRRENAELAAALARERAGYAEAYTQHEQQMAAKASVAARDARDVEAIASRLQKEVNDLVDQHAQVRAEYEQALAEAGEERAEYKSLLDEARGEVDYWQLRAQGLWLDLQQQAGSSQGHNKHRLPAQGMSGRKRLRCLAYNMDTSHSLLLTSLAIVSSHVLCLRLCSCRHMQ